MRSITTLLAITLFTTLHAEEPEFPLTADSKPQDGVPKGALIKDSHTAGEGSVFPGTEREVTLYLPAGFDRTKPASFMVFQDGVIYQAPVVFDNLIARGDIPPLVGVFVQPGVVPAPNENAQPRYNRSYEYDSVTDTYSTFLIDELLPALEEKHGLTFSTDPNDTAIAGNSSGGICAFMAAWHRPDRFRRVFSGVGTYVGIRGADRLPVLIRKFEPKPLRVFLQSGTGDNNLYCGDWWMANQMMERSLTWAGYDVNHAWGEGGHNQKHASQIFPDVLRWLWRDWKTDREIKANPKGESQWKGYEVVEDGDWEPIRLPDGIALTGKEKPYRLIGLVGLAADREGVVAIVQGKAIIEIQVDGTSRTLIDSVPLAPTIAAGADGSWIINLDRDNDSSQRLTSVIEKGILSPLGGTHLTRWTPLAVLSSGQVLAIEDLGGRSALLALSAEGNNAAKIAQFDHANTPDHLTLSPDGARLYASNPFSNWVTVIELDERVLGANAQNFAQLDNLDLGSAQAGGMCVDTEGRLYVATSLGIQVCDQLGRVNFIIPTPQQPHDVCFGGKDLSELFIACGDTIYKRSMKVNGIVSGQMPPVKPPKPKL